MTGLAFAVALELMFLVAGQAAAIQGQALSEEEAGKIHGVVVAPEGVRFPGVGVTIRHQASHTEYSLRTNSSGEYTFTKLPSGSYEVLLRAPLLTSARFTILKISSVEVVAGQTINLESQMRVSGTWDFPPEVPVMFPPTLGDIKGVVRDDHGAVMSGVDVTLLPKPSLSLERRTKTNSKGEYRFIDLLPGKYEVRLREERFCERTVSAKVVVGETRRVKTRLKTCSASGG